METTEKIVEAYVRYVKGWATIPNLRCAGQHEIDLLAIDPATLERYHIETSVAGSQSFSRLTDKVFDRELYKERTGKASQRRTIGFFVEQKFAHPSVQEKLAQFGFVPGAYRNVIVSWDWTEKALAEAGAAGIELWNFQDLMREIAASMRHERSYFTDDTLRTINLFVRALAAVEAREDRGRRAPRGSRENGGFWVYRNWVHQRARLHRASCAYCNDGAGTQGAGESSTGEWRAFAEKAEAEVYLASLGYEDARMCGTCG